MEPEEPEKTDSLDDVSDTEDLEETDSLEDAADEETVEPQQKPTQEISKGLKIFDYVLANICLLQFIFQLYMKLSGTPGAPDWGWVIMPILLASGLISHSKWARILCIGAWALLLGKMYFDYKMKVAEYMMQEMWRRSNGF